MKKGVLQRITGLIIMIFLAIAFVRGVPIGNHAEFDTNNSNIESNYVEGDFVRGAVSMSFSSQKNKNFSSNFNGGISLIDLLNEMNLGSNAFSCEPVDCENGFSSNNGEETKQFTLNGKETYGFKLVGENIEVVNLRFDIASNSGASCENQLTIDFFADKSIDYFNSEYANELCSEVPRDWGCFEFDEETEDAVITDVFYCEKITLPPAPAYTIGARITSFASDVGTLEMKLVDLSESWEEQCEINPDRVGLQDSDCVVEYASNKEFNAFVCIIDSDAPDEGEYEIWTETNNVCGGIGEPTNSNSYLTADFALYAQPMKYKAIGGFRFDNMLYEELNGANLVDDLNSYLNSKYQLNCSSNCVIPFEMFGITQQVVLNNSRLTYTKNGLTTNNKLIFDVETEPVEISSDFLMLDVEKMKFEVPSINGTHNFDLKFANIEVLSEEINVEVGFDFDINPKEILVGRFTEFVASSSTEDISSTTWDFGTGGVKSFSNDNNAHHIYIDEGNFTIEVTATAESGAKSTKKFEVEVNDAKTSANLTLGEYELRIPNLKNDLNSFPSWVRAEIQKEIGLEEIESMLVSVRNSFELPDADYLDIVKQLIVLDVPISIFVSEKTTLPAEVGYENINAAHIKEISETEELNNLAVKGGIINWMEINYDVLIQRELVTAEKDFGVENLLATYKVDLTPKVGATGETAYLIVDNPATSIVGGPNYDGAALTSGSAEYVLVEDRNFESVQFLIRGGNAPDIENLALHITPKTNGLVLKNLGDDIFPEEKKEFNFFRFFAGLFLVLFGFFAVYIILQTWYKKRYERHLFKNPDDLYNLVTYIYNSRRAGSNADQIRKLLREKKWKGEKITYAFKKLDGRRTGMWEIPVLKFLENRKVRREIQKKNKGRPVDIRFIKRRGI